MKTGVSWLDVKIGLRMLVKHPALTLVGGLGIAVSIAISVGFFSFIAAHAYPDIPLPEGDRIVALENRDVTVDNEDRQAMHDFVRWRGELTTVRELGAFRTVERNLIPRDGPPERVAVAEITAAGFRVPRVPPLLGRYLVADDERPGAPPVVVIGHDAWQRRFAGDRAIVGRGVRLGGAVHTVVGVMPERFGFPMNHQYWTPLPVDAAAPAPRTGPEIYMFGRLAPGVSREEAQAELDAVGRRAAAAYPETHANLRPMVMPYTHSLIDIQGTTTWMVAQMQLTMSLLLVVVALNVAVLVYARTAMRQGEIAVRGALGASRRRIVAQLFVEALVLSAVASAVGLGLAQFGMRLGSAILEAETGRAFWTDYGLRPATVLFTVGVAVLAAVIVGVLPALQATGRRLQGNLRQLGGGTGLRLGRTWTFLIVAQVAIAVAALPAAVNMGWKEIRTATTRPTFPTGELLAADVTAEAPSDAPAGTGPRGDSAWFGDRVGELLRRVEAEPAVAGATYAAYLPEMRGRVQVDGVPAPATSPTGHRVASEGIALDYLALHGARVLTGRGFEPADLGAPARPVVVNRAFARQVLGGGRALGRRLRYAEPAGDPGTAAPAAPERWYEIVGVVEDLQANPVDPDLVRPRVYYPVGLAETQDVELRVRLRQGAPADFAPRLRALAAAVDPSLPLGRTYSFDEAMRQEQLATRLVGIVVALVLASVCLLSAGGVYALTSFTVLRRRREIGIRSALGAHPRHVLASVFARVARQVALGLGVGLAAAALVDRLTGGGLLGGRAGVLLPAFGVLMAVVALLAALGPARRGLRIQPTEALRADA